jgi:hypothetical protein
MANRFSTVACLGLATLLGACSFASDALWPSLTGSDPKEVAPGSFPGQATGPAMGTAMPASGAMPPAGTGTAMPPPVLSQAMAPAPGVAMGTTALQPVAIAPGSSTGTFVGQKVQEIRGELARLQGVIGERNTRLQAIRGSTIQSSQRYYGTIAAVTTRLQVGTTPGNPILTQQWNQAQQELDRMASDIAGLSGLSNEVSGDSALAAFLLDSIRAAYRMSGAIDEDHRQLAVLEDETNRTVVLIDRVLNEVTQDVARQSAYLGAERGNLTALALSIKNGELLGPSLSNRAYAALGPSTPGEPARSNVADGRQPLVVIRFDRADVPYQQALYNAVSRALERRPQATFDLVAVSAAGEAGQGALNQSQSRRNAERVMRSLTEMGLPAARVNLSATTAQTATNEVHLYVR